MSMKSIRGAAGLAAIPGIERVWDDALAKTERVHVEQDEGLVADGKVTVTIKIELARKKTNSAFMDVSHSVAIAVPGYAKQGVTAVRDGDGWSFADYEQPELPLGENGRPLRGVTSITPRGE